MRSFDPLELDRSLAFCHEAWLRWRRAPVEPDAEHEVFGRHAWATRQATFDAVRAMPSEDPLARPLSRWVYRLAEQRINRRAIERCVFERRQREHPLDQRDRPSATLRALLLSGLEAGQGSGPWLTHFVEHAGALIECENMLSARRREVARRFALDSALELANPGVDVAALALRWLQVSQDWTRYDLRSDATWTRAALGSEAVECWPGRLTLPALAGLLGDSPLLERVPIVRCSLPSALGPASFARGFGTLGRCYAQALAPRDQPFVVAHDAYGLRLHSVGALFALLTLEPVFARRALGLSGESTGRTLASMTRVGLTASRLDALRVLLHDAALGPQGHLDDIWETWAKTCLPPTLAQGPSGAVPRLRCDGQQRFLGWLLAARWRAVLQSEHDEDWFRNPRAVEALRADVTRPPPTTTTEADAGEGLDHLERWCGQQLGA